MAVSITAAGAENFLPVNISKMAKNNRRQQNKKILVFRCLNGLLQGGEGLTGARGVTTVHVPRPPPKKNYLGFGFRFGLGFAYVLQLQHVPARAGGWVGGRSLPRSHPWPCSSHTRGARRSGV